ncbi:hypothetical protein X777_17010 [Ooceraea biroi]|uniref:Uncharacterized protein n=1 Tax=Ooceraea biroi TaxID=2015173 RepID=A0A026VU13_OOCBI|nr:hypothetical protein X777_17010 [Ooceraea biroi]
MGQEKKKGRAGRGGHGRYVLPRHNLNSHARLARVTYHGSGSLVREKKENKKEGKGEMYVAGKEESERERERDSAYPKVVDKIHGHVETAIRSSYHLVSASRTYIGSSYTALGDDAVARAT